MRETKNRNRTLLRPAPPTAALFGESQTEPQLNAAPGRVKDVIAHVTKMMRAKRLDNKHLRTTLTANRQTAIHPSAIAWETNLSSLPESRPPMTIS